ncbi:hypothetical protein [Sorangium sp. So ce381]|uniref:hypothetical protein n=1 Tax=Sorangium sp. So ce381 TaxID=3133307 RepID=UPI003F5C6254
MNLKSLVIAGVFAASNLFALASKAEGQPFARVNSHPVPGSTVSVGGGGVLEEDGTAHGVIAPSIEGDLFIALLDSWTLVDDATVEICYTLHWIGYSGGIPDVDLCQEYVLNTCNLNDDGDAYICVDEVGP